MRRRRVAVLAATLALVLGGAAAARAVDSREWVVQSVDDFLAGEFDGVILESPGTLRLGYATQETDVDAEHVWAVAQDAAGSVYVGTGNDGTVFVYGRNGSEQLAIELEGSQVYALTRAGDAGVYAASSPNGAVFKLSADGTVEEWYRPEATYIWALLVAPDGALYVATGDPATLVRVESRGEGTVVYTSDAPHFLALGRAADGTVYVGEDQTGLVTAVSPSGEARVVYDTPLSEIRSILPTPDGGLYFVAVQSEATVPRAVQALKLSGLSDSPGANGNQAPEDQQLAAAQAQLRRAGVVASVLYRVDPTGRVAPLWAVKGQQVFSAALAGEDVLLGTDADGTLFRVAPDGTPAVIHRGRPQQITAVSVGPDGQYVLGTAEAATLVRLGPGAPKTATYTSAVQDAGAIAAYGRTRWTVTGTAASPKLRVRAGNTQEPGAGWSAWSGASTAADGFDAGALQGRFFQFRLQWDSAKQGGVSAVHVPFVPRNLPPRVLSIQVEMPGRLAPEAANQGREADSAALNTLLQEYANGGPDKQAGGGADDANDGAFKITWKALDPNDDALAYAVDFRGVGETLWKEIDSGLDEAELAWDTTLVPDGEYELRVTADDAPSNAADATETATLVSEPVLVDNTGPVVGALRVSGGGANGAVTLRGTARDATLPLRRGRYSLDGQPWTWFAPDDAIFDSREESFTLSLEGLESGEHTVAVQVQDAAQNAGLAKQVFRVD